MKFAVILVRIKPFQSLLLVEMNVYFCTDYTHIRYTVFTMHVANETMNSTPEIHATPNFQPKVIKNKNVVRTFLYNSKCVLTIEPKNIKVTFIG